MKRVLMAIGIAIVLAVGSAQTAQASFITVHYRATDLTDVVPGQDLWQYEYFVTGHVFAENQSFSVDFDYTLYTNLHDESTTNPGWDLLVLQPDIGLSADGVFDALALTNNAALWDVFIVRFVWLGGPGTGPGPQPFALNEWDANGNFIRVITTGTTVPEPAMALLLLATIGAGLTRSAGKRRREERAGRP
jgi:hypothetical protein